MSDESNDPPRGWVFDEAEATGIRGLARWTQPQTGVRYVVTEVTRTNDPPPEVASSGPVWAIHGYPVDD